MDTTIPKDKYGNEQHTRCNVFRTMLLQICRDYPGLPDPRTLEESEIEFFYDGLRSELKDYQKKINKVKK